MRLGYAWLEVRFRFNQDKTRLLKLALGLVGLGKAAQRESFFI